MGTLERRNCRRVVVVHEIGFSLRVKPERVIGFRSQFLGDDYFGFKKSGGTAKASWSTAAKSLYGCIAASVHAQVVRAMLGIGEREQSVYRASGAEVDKPCDGEN